MLGGVKVEGCQGDGEKVECCRIGYRLTRGVGDKNGARVLGTGCEVEVGKACTFWSRVGRKVGSRRGDGEWAGVTPRRGRVRRRCPTVVEVRTARSGETGPGVRRLVVVGSGGRRRTMARVRRGTEEGGGPMVRPLDVNELEAVVQGGRLWVQMSSLR